MLSPKLLDILRSYWKAEHPKGWLFPGAYAGRPITRSAVEDACKPAFPSRLHRIPSDMPSLSTCSKPALICAPFNFCLVIAAWARHPDTCASQPAKSAPPRAHWICCRIRFPRNPSQLRQNTSKHRPDGPLWA